MDCHSLPIPKMPKGHKRCDYLFVADAAGKTWTVPIELKSGSLKAAEVLEQLQAGADAANAWLPVRISIELIPVLAHGPIHRQDLRILRARKIQLRGKRRATVLVKCGSPLAMVLK